MYVLKDKRCNLCGDCIEIISYIDKESRKKTVDSGECRGCGDITILPQDEYKEFTFLYCAELQN